MKRLCVFLLMFVCGGAALARAEDADALAKKLSNPLASLISVPVQQNFDFGGGRNSNGWQWTFSTV